VASALRPSPRSSRGRLRWAARDGFLVAGRDVAHWVREPQLIAWTLVFPIIFVVLFAYVLGSAMQVPGGLSYQEYVLPGMFVQTMAFGLGETLAAVQADNAKGVMDRFRSMPIAPSAVVVGRSLAGLLYSLVSLVILIGAGLLVGWRWHGTAWETLGAIGLLLLARMAFLWLGIYLGLRAKSPEMANGIYGLLYPVTMVSNAFAPPELMPTWLGVIPGCGCRALVSSSTCSYPPSSSSASPAERRAAPGAACATGTAIRRPGPGRRCGCRRPPRRCSTSRLGTGTVSASTSRGSARSVVPRQWPVGSRSASTSRR